MIGIGIVALLEIACWIVFEVLDTLAALAAGIHHRLVVFAAVVTLLRAINKDSLEADADIE